MSYRSLLPIFDELRGPRIVVRPYRLADAEALNAAISESRDELRPWLPFADEHQTVDATRDFITNCMAQWLLREDFNLGIFAASGEFLGATGFHIRNWEIGYFEIGYWLRTPAAGHGYMSEAVRLIVDYLFDHLAVNRVEIRCDARNTRSAAIPRRLGFVQEACLRSNAPSLVPNDDSLRDTLIFGLLREDPRWL